MAGFHPLFVNVQFGKDWGLAKDYWSRPFKGRDALKLDAVGLPWPWIAVSPAAYSPGALDLRCVSGCVVNLHDPGNRVLECVAAAEGRAAFYGVVYDLAAELAVWAAGVSFHAPAWGEPQGVDLVAHCFREWDRDAGCWKWPRWWSDDLSKGNAKRYEAWRHAASQQLVGGARAA